MFRIAPIMDKQEQMACANECSVPFRSEYFGIAMRDTETDELMGFCQFDLTSDTGIITELCPTPKYALDYEAMFILGRAVMNFIDNCGNHLCDATIDSAEEKLLHAIGFRKNEDRWHCDMTGFFDGNCGNH